MSFIIFKADFKSFMDEVHHVAYMSINTTSEGPHFVFTEAVLSGFNLEGRVIQLRDRIGNNFVSDALGRQSSLDRATETLTDWRVNLRAAGIECRDGVISTANKPVIGS